MAESAATEPDSKKDLVVVGASAGGVGALSTLVSTLPKSFPAPIVIAQHLDPQRPSHLGSILERRSTLPIVVVSEDPPTKLESGTIYVVPANRHVKIVDGHVQLEAANAERPKPSVDILLSSAARSYGENLIAVILTGSGSDGAAGAVEVKNAGGVVIIQNPQTAPYPSMPRSLPPTVVDHVVDMEQIGPLLYEILKGVNLPPPSDQADDPLQDLLTQVSARSNIDFRNYKSSSIIRRVGRRMAVAQTANIRDYADYLSANPDEVKELVKAFLIKVTGFFRDPEAFEFLKTDIIPALIDHANHNGRTLRIWSVGCATGEEAYSLALLVADHLGPDFNEWNIKVFATDLSADAISFARRGLYPENVLSELPDDYRDRYFERVEGGFRVTKSLRQVVIFGEQDISRGVPFPRIDLVSCRNLLIYLKQELQQVVLDLFAYSLQHSHGYLFLGKAETARPTKASFELINKKWKIYRCLGGPLPSPMQDSSLQAGNRTNELHESRQQPANVAHARAHDLTLADTDSGQLRRLNETLLRYLNVAVIIIDRQYRILTINSAARRLLGIRELTSDLDFLHTVRGMPYQEVRHAIDNSFRERTATMLDGLELDQSSEGSGRFVSFSVIPMQVEPGGGPELAAITALDVTDQVQTKKRFETVQRQHSDLINELSNANKRFSAMNTELQDANEELQAANEELMLTQEELQATNEEFEASNEELQATNEELETNNEELQATNEELQTTNDELTARTTELQELARQHRLQQLQLTTVLERYPYYVMVLNTEDLTIETINPAYTKLLGNRNVVGLPMSEVFRGSEVDELIRILKRSVRERQPFETGPIMANVDGAEEKRVQFVHTVVPIVDASGSVATRIFIYSEKAE